MKLSDILGSPQKQVMPLLQEYFASNKSFSSEEENEGDSSLNKSKAKKIIALIKKELKNEENEKRMKNLTLMMKTCITLIDLNVDSVQEFIEVKMTDSLAEVFKMIEGRLQEIKKLDLQDNETLVKKMHWEGFLYFLHLFHVEPFFILIFPFLRRITFKFLGFLLSAVYNEGSQD